MVAQIERLPFTGIHLWSSGVCSIQIVIDAAAGLGEAVVSGLVTPDHYVLDANGDFVVAWDSFGQDGSANGVYGQRYNAAGAAQGSEFRKDPQHETHHHRRAAPTAVSLSCVPV